jgi:hypothetical protein
MYQPKEAGGKGGIGMGMPLRMRDNGINLSFYTTVQWFM